MKKTNIEERERRYERASGKSKSREYLLQILNDYYGGYGNRIKVIGITCLDCKRQSCPESCIDKSRIELN
jgi:hypothetical protein